MKKTYADTLAYLYAQLPMYQRVGAAAFKKDLTNIRALLEVLGQPQERFASLHIAGTNGKGSVAHLLSGALQAAGYRTGLYTSPHYKDFRERIRVNGQYVSRRFVVEFTEEIGPELDRIRPSYFEITVAMAFAWFARQEVDVAVVEVGLGGRLDSTNIITPELSVITNISYDHMNMLGDTLPLIAGEKAGIIKAGVPVVVGETQEETAPVFRRVAAEREAPLYFADQHYEVKVRAEELHHTTYVVHRDQHLFTPELRVNLRGPYQCHNLQTALLSLEIWQRYHPQRSVPWPAVESAWADLRRLTRYQGRWQVLGEAPLVLVDSAHNEGGLRPVLAALWELVPAGGQLHIVLGVVNDKDLDQALPLFPTSARYYFAKADIPRGLPAEDLRAAGLVHGLQGRAYASVRNALRAAKRAAGPRDVIFVGGSIFTVAEVL
ncbi:MAG: bifunctional folylpolyglutamate synthase/dihydrofolate synthase [Lewinella sp.]|nr:bifunctional folylpolyglutamate synthase/dihydrofolate synthase [Lewinella sp.]